MLMASRTDIVPVDGVLSMFGVLYCRGRGATWSPVLRETGFESSF